MNKLSISILLFIVSVVYCDNWVPPSEHCIKVLIPEAKSCDRKYKATDDYCSAGYRALRKECHGNDSTLCGYKYAKFNEKCKASQNRFFAECNPIYEEYILECATAKEAAEDAREQAENAKDN